MQRTSSSSNGTRHDLAFASTKRLLDTGADDVRDDHESKRHKISDDTVPMAQEPSSGSGVKRSNLEAIRRADAEAEKALKRAKVLEERRAAKRQSATPMDELEESATNAEVTPHTPPPPSLPSSLLVPSPSTHTHFARPLLPFPPSPPTHTHHSDTPARTLRARTMSAYAAVLFTNVFEVLRVATCGLVRALSLFFTVTSHPH